MRVKELYPEAQENWGWGGVYDYGPTIADLGQIVVQVDDDDYQGVKWFGSKSEAAEWFDSHDWEGDYSWHAKEQQDFLVQAKKALQ